MRPLGHGDGWIVEQKRTHDDVQSLYAAHGGLPQGFVLCHGLTPAAVIRPSAPQEPGRRTAPGEAGARLWSVPGVA